MLVISSALHCSQARTAFAVARRAAICRSIKSPRETAVSVVLSEADALRAALECGELEPVPRYERELDDDNNSMVECLTDQVAVAGVKTID
jgi:hypothetical protein